MIILVPSVSINCNTGNMSRLIFLLHFVLSIDHRSVTYAKLTVAKAVVYSEDFLTKARITPLEPARMGVLTFEQDTENSEVRISGKLRGLSPGRHGFHIHELGNLEHGCRGTASHFNPTNSKHGPTWAKERHIGDLGNINAFFDTTSIVHIEDSRIQLSGPHSIIGRAVVIHEGEDDLGLNGDLRSLTTGSAGKRRGCGVIGVASIDYDPEDFSPKPLSNDDRHTVPAPKLKSDFGRPIDATEQIFPLKSLLAEKSSRKPAIGLRLHLKDRLKESLNSVPTPHRLLSSAKQNPASQANFYNCGKVPYKEICDSGRPSQFTLRYYYDTTERQCRLYPWGYCKGEHNIGQDPALRYLNTCEKVCQLPNLLQA